MALAQVGYVERPTNRTKFGAWYGLDGNPWCDMFVSWCFDQLGALELCHGKCAYTPTHAQRFKNAGQWGTTARPGAVVFFRFAGGPARIHHVGLVLANGGGVVSTVEGNTASGTAGSQANGGGVYSRRRTRGIVGYGYPAYAPPRAPRAGSAPANKPTGSRAVLRLGSTGPDVRYLKERLNAHSPASRQLNPELANFGPLTQQTVMQFQEAKGLKKDGVVGPLTWAALGQ